MDRHVFKSTKTPGGAVVGRKTYGLPIDFKDDPALAVMFGPAAALPLITALTCASEKDAVSAQKLGQLQPFTHVFPRECMGQLAPFGPT